MIIYLGRGFGLGAFLGFNGGDVAEKVDGVFAVSSDRRETSNSHC